MLLKIPESTFLPKILLISTQSSWGQGETFHHLYQILW